MTVFIVIIMVMPMSVIMVNMPNFSRLWWWNTNFFQDGIAMLVLNVLTMLFRYLFALLLGIRNAFLFLFENTIFHWLFLAFFFFHAMCFRNFFANWFVNSDTTLLRN